MSYTTTSPVAIVIFNREDKARALYSILKNVKPSKLYIIADGPRNKEEIEKCNKTRAVFETVEWTCEIKRNYSGKNLGCCVRPESGFTWVLQNEEYAIFLEDDCMPNEDFFRFCDEMLTRYKDDERIMQVCGTNFLSEWDCGKYSYYFAQWGSNWGWATWARAWKMYDVNMETWKDPEVKKMVKNRLGKYVYESRIPFYDEHCCNLENITAWDHQWSYTRLINNGLSILPRKNLVTNIGSGIDATHTSNMEDNSIPAFSLDFPLRHPPYVIPDREFDKKIEERNFNAIPIYLKALRKIWRFIKK